MVRAFELAMLVVALVLLWLFPIVVFPHPATNDAIELSTLELPVLGAGLLGTLLVLALRRDHATVLGAALGVFLLGVAADFVVGLVTFGNMQDDRFLPLLFLPFVFGFFGLVMLALGIVLGEARRPELVPGAAYGIGAAVLVGVWMLLRGARDWLLAPYGFDILVLIVVIGAAVAVLSLQVRSARPGG